MAIESNVVRNPQLVEYGKFVEIQNDSRFPAISVLRTQNRDQSNAFNNPTGQPAFSAVDIYPKYAVLTYDVGAAAANASPFGDNSSLDAFGRLRVSEPSTLLDSKTFYGKDAYLFTELLSGTGTSTFSAYDSCVHLETSAPGDAVIRQTRVRFNYQPGKSMQYMFTGLITPETNIIKRIGAFQSATTEPYTPSDGIWLEVTENGPVLRIEKLQGTPHSESVPQSLWNIDRFDGTGPSGITLDLTKAVLFSIDYEWLGVGRVRFGFYVNGKLYYVHADSHAGQLTAPYMTYSNQPVRYEIRQVGAGKGILKQICSTVLSEGGDEDVGQICTASLSASINLVSTVNVWTPIMAVKLKDGVYNVSALIKNVDVVNLDSSSALHYIICLNPTFSSPLTYTEIDSTNIMFAKGDGTVTATNLGYQLVTNYAIAGSKGSQSFIDVDKLLARLGTTVTGTNDVIAVIGRGVSGTVPVLGAMNLLFRG